MPPVYTAARPAVPVPAARPAPPVNPGPGGFLKPSDWAKTSSAQLPGATYQGYKAWVANTRAARANVGTPGSQVAQNAQNPFNAFLTRMQGSLMTPAQLASIAASQTKAQTAASQASIQGIVQQQQAMEAQRALGAGGYAQALATALRPDAGTIADQYRQSAQAMQGLGSGLTGSVQQAQQQEADTNAAKLAALGAPAIPTGPGTPTYDPAAIHNALQYANVVQPASDMLGQAQNAYALAAAQGAAGVNQVGMVGAQALQNVAQAQMQGNIQKMQLAAQTPSIYQQALSGIRSTNLQTMAALASALGMSSLYGLRNAQAGYYGTKAGTILTTAGTGLAKVTGVDKKGNILPGFYPQTDSRGNMHVGKIPAGSTYNWQTGKLIPKPATGRAAPNPVAQQAAVQRTIDTQNAANAKLLSSPPYVTKVPKFYQGLPGHDPQPAMPYQKAYTSLLGKYPKNLQGDPRVRSAVADALASAGYPSPPVAGAARTPVRGPSRKPLR